MFRIYGKAFLPRQDHIALRPTAAKMKRRPWKEKAMSNDIEAARLLKISADEGNADARLELGLFYFDGYRRTATSATAFTCAPPARDTLGRGDGSKVVPQELQ